MSLVERMGGWQTGALGLVKVHLHTISCVYFSGHRETLDTPPLNCAGKPLLTVTLLKEKFVTCDLTFSIVFFSGWKSRMNILGPNMHPNKPNEVTNVAEQDTSVTYQLSNVVKATG